MIYLNAVPQKVTPGYNPVILSFYSTLESQFEDFKYRIDIKNDNNEVIATVKIPGGVGSSGFITIDLRKYLQPIQNLDAWQYTKQTTLGYKIAGFKAAYSILIYETYNGESHLSQTLSDLYTIPAALSAVRFHYYKYDDIKTTGRWLTNFKSFSLSKNDNITVSYLMREGEVTQEMLVKFYNANGVLIYWQSLPNQLWFEGDVVHFHLGLMQIATEYTIPMSVIDDVAYYTANPSGGSLITFKIQEKVCRFKPIRLHFLNEWGGVDSFNFTMNSLRTLTTESSKAKLYPVGSDLRPNFFGFTNTSYKKTFADSVHISSDFIDDYTSSILVDLFTAPIILAEIYKSVFIAEDNSSDKILLPVELKQTTYPVKKRSAKEKLFNVEADIDILIQNERQIL